MRRAERWSAFSWFLLRFLLAVENLSAQHCETASRFFGSYSFIHILHGSRHARMPDHGAISNYATRLRDGLGTTKMNNRILIMQKRICEV